MKATQLLWGKCENMSAIMGELQLQNSEKYVNTEPHAHKEYLSKRRLFQRQKQVDSQSAACTLKWLERNQAVI